MAMYFGRHVRANNELKLKFPDLSTCWLLISAGSARYAFVVDKSEITDESGQSFFDLTTDEYQMPVSDCPLCGKPMKDGTCEPCNLDFPEVNFLTQHKQLGDRCNFLCYLLLEEPFLQQALVLHHLQTRLGNRRQIVFNLYWRFQTSMQAESQL